MCGHGGARGRLHPHYRCRRERQPAPACAGAWGHAHHQRGGDGSSAGDPAHHHGRRRPAPDREACPSSTNGHGKPRRLRGPHALLRTATETTAKSRRRHPPPGGGRGTFAAKGWRLRRARQVAAASALQDASPSNGRRILPPRGHARPPGAMRLASEIVRLPAGPIGSRLSGRRAVTPPVRSGPCAWSGRPPRAGRPPPRPAAIWRPRPRALRSPGRAA